MSGAGILIAGISGAGITGRAISGAGISIVGISGAGITGGGISAAGILIVGISAAASDCGTMPSREVALIPSREVLRVLTLWLAWAKPEEKRSLNFNVIELVKSITYPSPPNARTIASCVTPTSKPRMARASSYFSINSSKPRPDTSIPRNRLIKRRSLEIPFTASGA
jgi:hypothetical protein